MRLVFWYVVCNKHFYKPAKNQTGSRKFPEIMAKKRSRGHPNRGSYDSIGICENNGHFLSNFSSGVDANIKYGSLLNCVRSELNVTQ